MRSAFLATPYRPTGLSTPARTTVRLVDELIWLNSIVIQPGLHRDGVNRTALSVKQAAAAVLDRAADLLDSRGGNSDELDAALTELAAAHAKMQEGVTAGLPVRSLRPAIDPAVAGRRPSLSRRRATRPRTGSRSASSSPRLTPPSVRRS